MSYIFLKPKTTNIAKDTWNKLKTDWLFWLPFPFIYFFGPVVLTIPAIYYFIIYNRVRVSFWKEFAEINGWQYKNRAMFEIFDPNYVNIKKESGIMFKEGNSRRTYNEIDGTIQDRKFRIFCYEFSIGSGKHRTVYYYTIFAFKFDGLFPHIYLNHKNNSWGISTGEKIPLPAEFEDKFYLMAPKEYEIEALEIFTPDVLVNLLDNGFSYDVEFVDQEILVFVDGHITNFEKLEKSFNKSLELVDLMSKKLDKFKFQQIGDRSSNLN